MPVVGGQTYTLAYDAENRLVSVTGPSLSATFTYDADGKRVQSVINGTTIKFIGAHYEVEGTTIRKYYLAGATRVAMRTNSDSPVYFLQDHLGSTSITTDASGNLLAQLWFKAWGEVRYTSGTTPTKYTYTGQYSNTSDFGLMYYGARWYDPAISHFTQPDTLIPGQNDPQAYDKYAYTNNNPLIYTDPSGHMACNDWDDSCGNTYNNSNNYNSFDDYFNNNNSNHSNNSNGHNFGSNNYDGNNNYYDDSNNGYYHNEIGPITKFIKALPFTEDTYENLATGLDLFALLLDLYASGIVTYGGLVGAGVATPFAMGGPEVPIATGASGAMIAELYVQPLLYIAHWIATVSLATTIIADTKAGNTRIDNLVISSTVSNSLTLTSLGWINKEAYISLVFQTVAVGNDFNFWSLPNR